ncbi:hypothetical protein KQX54_011868, partial [Cotesia glomerata]
SITDPNFRSDGIKLICNIDAMSMSSNASKSEFRTIFLKWCFEKVEEINELWLDTTIRSLQLSIECHGLMFFLAESISKMKYLVKDLGLLLF